MHFVFPSTSSRLRTRFRIHIVLRIWCCSSELEPRLGGNDLTRHVANHFVLAFFWTTPRNKNFDFLWAHFLEKAFPWHAPLKLWNCLSRVCGGYVFEAQIRLGRSLLFRASIFRKRGATERTAVQKQRRTEPRTKMENENFGSAFVRNCHRRHRRANKLYIYIYIYIYLWWRIS